MFTTNQLNKRQLRDLILSAAASRLAVIVARAEQVRDARERWHREHVPGAYRCQNLGPRGLTEEESDALDGVVRYDLTGWLGRRPTRTESCYAVAVLRALEAEGLIDRIEGSDGARPHTTHLRLLAPTAAVTTNTHTAANAAEAR